MTDTAVETKGARVLVVDDVAANLKTLSGALEPSGYRIQAASDGRTALRLAASSAPDIILLDVMMPGLDGYETCRRLKEDPTTAGIPVVFITARTEPESLVEGFQAGGVDYLVKPFSQEEVLARVETHLKIGLLTRQLREKNAALEAEIARRAEAEDQRDRAGARWETLQEREVARWGLPAIVGRSPTLQRILQSIRKLRKSRSASTLITGESGTGKEMIARAIHSGDGDESRPFIALNCSAIPSELAESTLFGHVKGAFTGAHNARKGAFEQADGGTLFLDEIGDMPIELQAKLLRVLEDGVIVPVGGAQERTVGVRVIAASNADFAERCGDGRFREDLYYRLARFVVELPPLRERPEDIPLLADHFVRLFADEMKLGDKPNLSDAAMKRLVSHDFPGNIRELKNVIERAVLECENGTIASEHLHFMNLPRASRQVDPAGERIGEESSSADPVFARDLLLKRAAKGDEEGIDPDENKILEYIRAKGFINNADCRELVSADRHRANYLLKKLSSYGLIAQEGSGRWAIYRLAKPPTSAS